MAKIGTLRGHLTLARDDVALLLNESPGIKAALGGRRVAVVSMHVTEHRVPRLALVLEDQDSTPETISFS